MGTHSRSAEAPMSGTKERQLIAAAQGGDRTARDSLVEAHLGLVRTLASQYAPGGDPEDAFQNGTVGLLEAIDKFDVSSGHRLSTYAYSWIHKRIQEGLASETSGYHVPARTLARYHEAVRKHPTDVALARAYAAEHLSMEPETFDAVRRAVEMERSTGVKEAMSDRPMDGSEEWGAERDPEPDHAPVTLEAMVVQSLMADLPEQEAEIVSLAYGLTDGHPRTDTEVGAILGLSRNRVSAVRNAALRRLAFSPDLTTVEV